ncbi:multinuclear nonheme iron-dependent oxidase [Burkholderia stagnalis]
MQSIGLGLDYQHRHSYSKSLTALLESLTPRLSHVSIVGLVTDADVQAFKAATDLPILHHFTGVAPGGTEGVNLGSLQRQANITRALQALWCLEDIGIWNIGPYNIPYFAPPVLCREVLDQTVAGVSKMQCQVSAPFLAELPSCSFVVGDITLDSFFNELVARTGCGIVLDVSHVFSYAIYTARDPIELLLALPLDSVIEIHVAGGSVHPQHEWRYRDTHVEPILDEIVGILEVAIKHCRNLRAITYEIGIGISLDLVDRELSRLQGMADALAFTPRLGEERRS